MVDNKFLFCDDSLLSKDLDLDSRYLYVSVNPDLRTHYGHFLHYERRMKEVFDANNCDFICLANVSVESLNEGFIIPTYTHDSGHYSFYRASAKNICWETATNEFLYLLASSVKTFLSKSNKRYAGIKYFMYTGSVRLAYQLSRVFDEPKSTFVINGFWDFLSLAKEPDKKYFGRIQFNSQVQFLSMSDIYAKHIFSITNFLFDFIPNPPPLCNDHDSIQLIKKSCLKENNDSQIAVYMPSLLTDGKGFDFTQAFISEIADAHAIRFYIRDKSNKLDKPSNSNINYIIGDLKDNEVFKIYENSDFVIIPYDSKTFQMRTSGVIVDCLLFGSIPIVFEGTWMAHVCKKYGFGIITTENSSKAVLKILYANIPHISTLRGQMYRAALNYLMDNSWSHLIRKVYSNNMHYSHDDPPKKLFNKILNNKNRRTHLLEYIKTYKTYRILLNLFFPENTKRRLFVKNLKIKLKDFIRKFF